MNAPKLNYPIHIPFYPPGNFNEDLVLNERFRRFVISNESFNISININVKILSVSLPSMGWWLLQQDGSTHTMFQNTKKSSYINTQCIKKVQSVLAVGLALLKRDNSKHKLLLYRIFAQKAEKNYLFNTDRQDFQYSQNKS